MDVYRYMYKLAPSSAEKIVSQSTGASLPAGYLTDGLGNIYKIPTKGKTPLISINDDDRLKYSYNWQTKEVEIYSRNDENNKYSFLTSYGVTPENFADGPEYWFNQAKEEADSEIESELAWMSVSEGFLDSDLGDEKDNYVYHIRFDYDVNGEYDDWDAVYDSIKSILTSYDIKQELYTQELSIKSVSEENESYLVVTFPMELTKEELIEIWDNYEEYMLKLFSDAGYNVDLSIEGMFEV